MASSSSSLKLSSWKDGASSSCSKDEKDYMIVKQDYVDGEKRRRNSIRKEMDTEQKGRQRRVQKRVTLKPCGICYEASVAEMFDGIRCSHRFCHPCMTKYIHTQLGQKRHHIYCPHDSCGEALNPQECTSFLPEGIMDSWNAIILEAEIPESQKVYCPFPNCSSILVKEDVDGEITNAECPSCHRMFCVRCMVPWHGDMDCEEFQRLPLAERSEEDRQLLRLAKTRKWQRCGKCKSVIELQYGCNHMTCRCGYEFCYKCGNRWGSNCNCP